MKTSRLLAGFLLVAAAMAGLEWLDRDRHPAADTLVVSAEQQAFVRREISGGGQDDSAYQQALSGWIDEEILYREGLKLGLERDDLIVKRRVVQKMRFLLEDMTPVQPPTRAQLQAWLDRHPSRYRSEQTYRFEHRFFSRGKRGDEALFQARAALARLKAGEAVEGDPFPLATGQGPVGIQAVGAALGSTFPGHLDAAPPGVWSGPFNSALGVHLVRVLAHDAGRAQTLDEAEPRLRVDLAAAQREAVNAATLQALRSAYHVEIAR